MNKSVSLILVNHNHVPYGAEDEEFELVYTGKLKPFIVALNNYPHIQGTLHYSGVLLHWIERAHPEFFMLIGDLVSRKQVELVGGGFYEPMMPLISQQDKIGQIELLTDYLRKHFSKKPLGCWLPALAWEPDIVDAFSRCGMGYTFLSEEQFRRAGLGGDDLFAPCLTENQGKLLTVFPLLCVPPSTALSSAPSPGAFFAGIKPEGLFEALEKLAAAGNAAAGEGRIAAVCSNGILGESLDSQGAEKGISLFFEELSRCESFAGFTTPAKVLKNCRVYKKAYFGTDSKSSVKRFLVEYPEANGIYAKSIFTHVLVNQLRGDKARKTAALEELWKAQGYDAFCRSWSGGFYRGDIRNAVYKSLLIAEKTARIKGVFIPSLMNFDFDFDGEDEYIFRNDHISVYIKKQGAAVFEFDFIPRSWNYLGTLLPREAGAGPGVPEMRMAFADILAFPGFSPAALAEAGFSTRDAEENGKLRFCGAEPYEVLETDKARQKACFRLEPGGGASGSALGAVEINKTCCLKRDSLLVQYRLVNRGARETEFDFTPRLDLVFPGEGDSCLRVYKVGPEGKDALRGGQGELPVVQKIELDDLENELIITLSCDKAFDAHIVPVYADCPVYGREQRLYQSTCVLPVTRLSLESGGSWSADYTLRLAY
ncbi:MAG: DUF1926 domain-containing protein [Treponema sp.]|jgi:hypothetical protein|nr:DUF1926 domain-containing protein [Treponema sp.]